jgi:hypothetical protein
VRKQVGINEPLERLPRDTMLGVVGRSPVSPAIWLVDEWPEPRPFCDFPSFFARVKGLEEEQPRELGDAVQVAVEASVLAHDVASTFDYCG